MLLRCGEQYRRRYIEKEIIPPSGNLVRGKCGHKAEEKNFVQKIETKTDLPLEAVKDFFSDEWETRKYEIGWTEEELDGNSIKKAEAKFKDSGILLVDIFHREQAPLAMPVAVEDEFIVNFQGGYPSLKGIIDRVDADDSVNEQKFLSKSPSANDALVDIQLTSYDFGFRQKYKRKPSRLVKQCGVATKTPKTVRQEAPPREDDTLSRFLNRLEKAMEAISKGIFLPAANGSWACSPKMCGYYRSCKFRP